MINHQGEGLKEIDVDRDVKGKMEGHSQKENNMLQMDKPREREVYLDEKQSPISLPMCFCMGVCKDLRM